MKPRAHEDRETSRKIIRTKTAPQLHQSKANHNQTLDNMRIEVEHQNRSIHRPLTKQNAGCPKMHSELLKTQFLSSTEKKKSTLNSNIRKKNVWFRGIAETEREKEQMNEGEGEQNITVPIEEQKQKKGRKKERRNHTTRRTDLQRRRQKAVLISALDGDIGARWRYRRQMAISALHGDRRCPRLRFQPLISIFFFFNFSSIFVPLDCIILWLVFCYILSSFTVHGT